MVLHLTKIDIFIILLTQYAERYKCKLDDHRFKIVCEQNIIPNNFAT